MSRSRSLMLLSLAVSLLATQALAQDARLPLPLNPGGHGGHMLPAARSDDLAAHIRGTVLLHDLPSGQPEIFAQLGLSFSLFRWGEAGVTFAASPHNSPIGIDLRPGPLVAWGRLSPPLFGEHLALSGQIEYAIAPAPLDGGGTLFPDAQTLSFILGYQAGRLQLLVQGAAQLADTRRYKGAQGGAGVWLLLVKSLGMTVGIEVLGRAGQLDGELSARTGWAVVMGFGALDEWGFRGGVGYLLGDGLELPASSAIVQMGVSYGRAYKRPPPDPFFMSPAPVPPWLMALYSRWFPTTLIDPILLPNGVMIDDDGTPLYQAGDPDPEHPGLLRLRRSGQRFAPGTHFYRMGRWLLTNDGTYVESLPPEALAALGFARARRLALNTGAAIDRAIHHQHAQAAAAAIYDVGRGVVYSATGLACGVVSGVASPFQCYQMKDSAFLIGQGAGRVIAGVGQWVVGSGGQVVGVGLDSTAVLAPGGVAVHAVSAVVLANGTIALVRGQQDVVRGVQLAFSQRGAPSSAGAATQTPSTTRASLPSDPNRHHHVFGQPKHNWSLIDKPRSEQISLIEEIASDPVNLYRHRPEAGGVVLYYRCKVGSHSVEVRAFQSASGTTTISDAWVIP